MDSDQPFALFSEQQFAAVCDGGDAQATPPTGASLLKTYRDNPNALCKAYYIQSHIIILMKQYR